MKIYIYILNRDMIIKATHDAQEIFQLASRGEIGQSHLGGWKRIQVWENGLEVKTITVNGNSLVKMPEDKEELWKMLNE